MSSFGKLIDLNTFEPLIFLFNAADGIRVCCSVRAAAPCEKTPLCFLRATFLFCMEALGAWNTYYKCSVLYSAVILRINKGLGSIKDEMRHITYLRYPKNESLPPPAFMGFITM
jgi:hypothetical protein